MGFRLDNESSIVPEASLEFHHSKFRGPKIFEISLGHVLSNFAQLF